MSPSDYRLSGLALRPGADPGSVELRLGNGWLEPCHLVGAAAVAERASTAGLAVRVHGPSQRHQANYAARMRLGAVLADLGVAHDLPTVREKDLSTELFEVMRLQTEGDARALAELVAAKVEPQHPKAAYVLWECISEMGINVRDHAQAPGFGAAQTLPTAGEVLFAVADSGVGLRATLALHGAVTDRDGISLALSGLSRLADPDRGRGLTTTLSALGEVGGELYLASGSASARATTTSRQHGLLTAAYPGTLVQGRVPCGRLA